MMCAEFYSVRTRSRSKGPATRNDVVNDIVNDARADAIFAPKTYAIGIGIVDDEMRRRRYYRYVWHGLYATHSYDLNM